MRYSFVWKSLKVKEETKALLEKERLAFEKTIGGSWSYDDTINELYKIAKSVTK